MTIARSATTDRLTGKNDTDRAAASRGDVGTSSRPILLIGDDMLMVRALSRLLQLAGYAVGTENRCTGQVIDDRASFAGDKSGLTIVDLPDHHILDAVGLDGAPFDHSRESGILWIGSTPPATESAWFLAKPFTSEEFLSRVRLLIAVEP